MNFGTKLKLKKDWEYGLKLHHPRVAEIEKARAEA